jgi:hypothetical protein
LENLDESHFRREIILKEVKSKTELKSFSDINISNHPLLLTVISYIDQILEYNLFKNYIEFFYSIHIIKKRFEKEKILNRHPKWKRSILSYWT